MTTTYLPNDYDIFVGIDVDKKSFSFNVKDHNVMNRSKKMPSSPEQFYNYIQNNFSNKRVLCAYEAGPTGFHLYDYLTEKNIPCYITSPSSIPVARNSRVKTNRIDSERISQSMKSGELKPIRVPQGIYRELRYLTKTRELYSRNQKAAKQRIKALLLYANLYPTLRDPEFKWSNCLIKELKMIPCSSAIRSKLNLLIMDIEYARDRLLYIYKELKAFCDNNKEIKQHMHYLQTIPGIGFVVASSILGNIGDPEHLKNPRELGGFTGLVPFEHSTGDTVNKGSITHLGNQTLRFMLIEAAWTAIRKDTGLKQFYDRIKNRHHSLIASKKAITAVARKLTLIIYKILKEQRAFIAR